MARSTRKSLAGSAVSVARKAIRRKSADKADTTSSTTSTAKPRKQAAAAKQTAKKTAKQATATSTATKSTPAKKTPAKKATTKQASATKKTATKKTATKKTAEKATTKQVSATKKTAERKTAKQAPAKKVAAKKAPAKKVSALVVKEGESAWTKAEIREVRNELNEIREKVARTLAQQETELAGLMRDAGDGAGHDQADMGATSFERDHELTVVNNEREKLAQIDRALARIADGSYGICESCGNPIGKMRVMAFPRATLCMTCKQREERR